ncbi:Transcriptional regulatory protein, C terminal [Mesorhizobium albiziae]|uniref:Transcriptional regulatory protein, C terminal n=2 Tax=Neomesorhizobium albiziae TaxID=335020 RepID=A0A1I4BYU6_9HYPH|nr:helix-turn-helix domain-containing protein [Mesorhizobium albiziae]GLS29598.1 hypothetical protein GCM10007937_13060 [Mesorhizobium albiziae]SFK73693.1 Transcriptional regulatory protein, C terminal [Mesorhizobium albiziae]
MPEGPVPREELAGLAAEGKVEFSVLRRLARRPGHWVSIRELIDAVYGDRADGGPESAEQIIRNRISMLMPRLLRHGWAIEGGRGLGGEA